LHVKLAAEPLCGLLQQNQVQRTPDSILPREKRFAAEKIADQPSAYPRAAERDIPRRQTTRHSMRPRKIRGENVLNIRQRSRSCRALQTMSPSQHRRNGLHDRAEQRL